MKFEDFTSGTWKQQYQYKSFQPTTVNREWSWEDPRINVLLAEANRTLGELNAMTMIAPNVDLFINMHVAKEATMSSRIEGTKTEMDEVFLDEMDLAPERRQDQREVKNYIRALNTAILELERLFVMKQEHDHLVIGMGRRAESAAKLLAYLYDNPVIDTIKCMEINDLTKNSARGLIKEFEAVGLLRETTGYKRNRQYEFTGYLDAFHAQTPE